MLINQMTRRVFMSVMLVGMVVFAVTGSAQQPQVGTERFCFSRIVAVPGYQATLVEVRIPAGGREGRHTHPGTILVRVEEGALTLDYEGKPTVTYKAGESFAVEPGKVHEGINRGTTPIRAIASFVTRRESP
jgi:quercetin dioxygenase-like cupin family protein